MINKEHLVRAREIDKLFYELVEDVLGVTKIWEQRDDELSHRLYVRTVFACVEGIIQVMKSAALLFDERNDPPMLTLEEIALLKEEDPHVGGNGKVEIKKKKISLLPNFEFSIRTYAKIKRCPINFEKGGEGWASLRKSISIRDRLTHPHSIEDLKITNEELKTVEKAMEFFRDTTIQLLGDKRSSKYEIK